MNEKNPVFQTLSVLFVGGHHLWTCKARYDAMQALGLSTTPVNHYKMMEKMPVLLAKAEGKFGFGPVMMLHNRQILREVSKGAYDWVWVDQGRQVYPDTIRQLRKKGLFLIHHINDDFKNPRGGFGRYIESIPDYHVHLTIHHHHQNELKALGAQTVIQTYHGFDPAFVFPGGKRPVPDPAYRTDVIFIGHRRDYCEECVLHLIENDIDVTVWGPGWERSPNRRLFRNNVKFRILDYPDYSIAIASAKIALAFLSHENRNQSTIRSFEIPAIGTFMMGERTDEHRSFFREGEEAEFFQSPGELLDKIKYYLAHNDLRKGIAAAGHERAMNSGYSYPDRVRNELDRIMPFYKAFQNERR